MRAGLAEGRAVWDAELSQKIGHVLLHRLLNDTEPECDPFVLFAAQHELQYLTLPRGEV